MEDKRHHDSVERKHQSCAPPVKADRQRDRGQQFDEADRINKHAGAGRTTACHGYVR